MFFCPYLSSMPLKIFSTVVVRWVCAVSLPALALGVSERFSLPSWYQVALDDLCTHRLNHEEGCLLSF